MKKSVVFILVFVLMISGARAQSTAGTGFLGTFASQSCTALYNNQVSIPGGTTVAIFPSVFVNGNLGLSVGELALAVVLAVFGIIAVAYGVGYGFGIRKLVEFAKAETLESVFNLVLIMVIAGTLVISSNYAGFFGYLTNAYSGQTSASQFTGSTNAVYDGLCQNLINTQIGPSISALALTLINLPLYTMISSLSMTVSPALPGLPNFVPSMTFKPLGGVDLNYQAVVFLLLPIFITLFLGITINLLFLFIFFLFPVFLYLGVLFRSFPWTRAAGGALLALFISFYIVFPALYYPVTILASGQIYTAQNSAACTSFSPNSGFGNCQSPATTYGYFLQNVIGGNVAQFSSLLSKSPLAGAGVLAFVASLPYLNPGLVFIQLMDVYISYLAFALLNLIGLAIAFIISFDLLEALGDFLGSPSLTSGRIFERLI